MTRRIWSTLAIATLAASLLACQSRTAYFPSFSMGADGGATAPTAAGAAALPSENAALTPPGFTSSALQAQVSSAHAGELTVTLSGAFLAQLHSAKRHVLATVADIANVTITVQPASGAAQQQTIPQAALIAGTTSATFTGLSPGSVTITIAAFDASGANIGSSTQTVNVTAGAPTPVSLSVQLDPTYTGVASGTLATNVTFTNGPTINGTPTPTSSPVPTGTLIGRYDVGGTNPLRLAFDHTGNAWIADYGSNQITELSGTGTLLKQITTAAPSDLKFDSSGNLWVANYELSGTVSKITPAGSVSQTYTVAPYPSALAFDALGNLWVASYVTGQLVQFAPALGMPVGAAAVGQFPLSLGIDGLGRIWSTNFHSSDVTRLGPTGTPIDTIALTTASATADPENMVFDSAGNAWITNNASQNVTKITSAGTVAGSYTLGNGPYGLAFDHNAHLWVANTQDNTVTELDQTGAVLGTYPVGHSPKGVAVDSKGDIWVTCYDDNVVEVLAP